jgi:hypothetical protein
MRTAGSLAVAICFYSLALSAQETNQIQQLQQQLRQMQENFEKIQQEQRRQLDSLQKQIELLQQNQAKNPPPAVTNAPPPSATPDEPAKSWSPTAPLTLFGNQKNYLNLSLDALMAAGLSTAKDGDLAPLELGGHDPQQNGFTLQNLELVLDGAVDPYFRAQANLVFQVDSSGDSTFELEEAYAETTSLPGNLQVKAGQYMTEFGRLNPTHPHTWTFVDVPLVNGRFFGPDGLRSQGARVSWLAPTPFYSELYLGVQNSYGETAYSFRNPHPDSLLYGRAAVEHDVRSPGDLLLTPRYATSFDLSDTQTALLGASAAFGPNSSGQATATQIYGVDLFWKWKPVNHHGGFPFVSWQTEAMLRRYEAGAFSNVALGTSLPDETLWDYGFYSQLSWGFSKGWIAGFRGDWVSGNQGAFYPDPDRDTRWRLSPDLTWLPTEFSKLRLQYNYDERQNYGADHSVWLQFEFMLGAHAAHKF